MDQRRKKIIEADRMAEEMVYIARNRFLDDADSVTIKKEKSYAPNITKWVKISGYRALNNAISTRELVNRAAANWISSKRDFEDQIGYAILINGDDTGIFYGSRRISPGDIFKSVIPECNIQEMPPQNLFTQYNGIMLGSLEGDNLAEMMLNSGLSQCYVSLFIVPYTSAEVENRILELEKYYEELEPYKSFQRTYGSATRRIEVITNNTVNAALMSIRENIDYLKKYRGIGLVRTILKYGACDLNEYQQITGMIHSVMRTSEGSYCEPIRSFRIEGADYNWSEHLSVPYALLNGKGIGVYLLSMQSIDRMAALCALPSLSSRYFFVKYYNIDECSVNLYGMEKAILGEIYLGKSMISKKTIGIPLKKLTGHACIFGGTGAGKTTTMKRILVELNKKSIPFVVIEAAKKEYVDLIGEVTSLRVYTPGTDGALLAINPLEPEDGTLIENQVDMLVRAIVAAHGNEHPIPESFEGLLKYTYEKNGWHYGETAFRDIRRPFPTFYDVYLNINEYIDRHAPYGAEVRQNLIAALTLRSENLYSGAMGRCFEHKKGLTAKEILDTPTVIELADFSESATTFVMNVLMYKIQSYLSRQSNSDDLKHVIVVEEAHNVFRKSKIEDSGRDINNQYFDKMFSEIRASGTGIIVSDQRPDVLSDAVIANTSIKLIHVMENKTDRDIVANAIDLTDIQKKKIRELETGECLISVRGIFGQDMVKVDRHVNRVKANSACVVCNARHNCKKRDVINRISSYPLIRKTYFTKKIMSNPYNPSVVNSTVDNMMLELGIDGGLCYQLCVLGVMLAQDPAIPFEVARVIVSTYRNHLRGGGTEWR